MPNAIEYLEERDDVKKTEYTRLSDDQFSHVKVEMWHDVEGLHYLFERARQGNNSTKGLNKVAEERALAVRETTTLFKAMYPKVLDRLKEESEKNEDYEYKRSD